MLLIRTYCVFAFTHHLTFFIIQMKTQINREALKSYIRIGFITGVSVSIILLVGYLMVTLSAKSARNSTPSAQSNVETQDQTISDEGAEEDESTDLDEEDSDEPTLCAVEDIDEAINNLPEDTTLGIYLEPRDNDTYFVLDGCELDVLSYIGPKLIAENFFDEETIFQTSAYLTLESYTLPDEYSSETFIAFGYLSPTDPRKGHGVGTYDLSTGEFINRINFPNYMVMVYQVHAVTKGFIISTYITATGCEGDDPDQFQICVDRLGRGIELGKREKSYGLWYIDPTKEGIEFLREYEVD